MSINPSELKVRYLYLSNEWLDTNIYKLAIGDRPKLPSGWILPDGTWCKVTYGDHADWVMDKFGETADIYEAIQTHGCVQVRGYEGIRICEYPNESQFTTLESLGFPIKPEDWSEDMSYNSNLSITRVLDWKIPKELMKHFYTNSGD